MSVKLNSTGGGSVTLDSPSTASNYTVTLPSAAGTLATTTGTGSVFTNPTINGFTGDTSAITVGTTQFVKDTSGNIGIGTASPSSYGKFVVNNSAASNSTVLIQALLTNRSYSTSNNGLSIVATPSNGTLGTHDFGAITFNEAPNSNGGSAYINMYVGGNSSSYGSNPRFLQAYSSGGSGWADYVTLWAGGYERARLDSSGNLGLGVTPSAWLSGYRSLDMAGNTSFASYTVGAGQALMFANSYRDVGGNYFAKATGVGYQFTIDAINQAGFSWGLAPSVTGGTIQAFTKVMTLDASGNLIVGDTTSPIAARVVSKNTVGQYSYVSNAANQFGGYYHFACSAAGSAAVGGITSSGTTTSFNTTSDQRLKENIVDAPNALASIKTIKVRSFDWKLDGSHAEYGYIAQELLEVAPEAVSVPADPEEMMGVDFGKLTPRIIKALQELSAQNQALEVRLAQLEAK